MIIAVISAIFLWIGSPFPAAAQSLAEYFQMSYDPVSFSRDEVHGDEVFEATIRGSASCKKTLPVTASEANITSHVLAEHAVNGSRVEINTGYTVVINPFPSREGDVTEINQAVPLQFPSSAESGDYQIIGEIIEAKVKTVFGWVDVTGYLPNEQKMGTLKYVAAGTVSESRTESEVESSPVPEPASAPEPGVASVPAPAPKSMPAPAPIEYIVPWWVWLIFAVAVMTTVVNVFWFLRQRKVQQKNTDTV